MKIGGTLVFAGCGLLSETAPEEHFSMFVGSFPSHQNRFTGNKETLEITLFTEIILGNSATTCYILDNYCKKVSSIVNMVHEKIFFPSYNFDLYE